MRVGYLVGGGLHGVSATWPSSAAPPHLKLRTWVARWARIRQPDHRMQSNEVSITGTQEPRRHMLRRWPTALGVGVAALTLSDFDDGREFAIVLLRIIESQVGEPRLGSPVWLRSLESSSEQHAGMPHRR
jgi:hypothetical protein